MTPLDRVIAARIGFCTGSNHAGTNGATNAVVVRLSAEQRSTMRPPAFTETLQIAVVVHDLEATMRTYVHEYGIGPWEIYEFNPSTVTEMVKDGAPAEYAMRLAVTMVGSVQWELIQPLDHSSMYAEFLAAKGEGLHHVGVGVAGYQEALDDMRGKGRTVLQGGVYNGVTFAYLSTDEDLGVVTEIFDWPPGLVQEPDAVYPA
jgi:methylmalonyl-CoA/ethylmalonyl-CoA epimerase